MQRPTVKYEKSVKCDILCKIYLFRILTYRRGFSLVEQMVVVAVIGIIAAVSVPNLVTGLPKYRVRSAAVDLISKMRVSRFKAIKEKRTVRMLFYDDAGIYSVDGEAYPRSGSFAEHYGSGVGYGFGSATKSAAGGGGSLPSRPITFWGNPKYLAFNSRGLSNPGSVYLCNNKGDAYCIVVNSAGRLRLRHWTGGGWE